MSLQTTNVLASTEAGEQPDASDKNAAEAASTDAPARIQLFPQDFRFAPPTNGSSTNEPVPWFIPGLALPVVFAKDTVQADGFGLEKGSIDFAPSVGKTKVSDATRPPLFSKGAAVGAVAGFYAALYTWTYFAWYRKRATSDHIIWHNEGWFSRNTYAGGADKLGHAWANYAMNRITANALLAGGFRPRLSAAMGAVGAMGFFTFIEIKDGYHNGFGFSWGDMAANTAGNLFAGALTVWPRLDDYLDFKVEYRPTRLFVESLVKKGIVDAGEDYSGQTFLLSYHLNAMDTVKQSAKLAPLRYVDVTLGYGTRNYLPKPKREDTPRHREVSLGLAFNVQQLIDDLYGVHDASRGHLHGSFRMAAEFLQAPYTNIPVVRYRTNDGAAPPEEKE